jgi:TP901 family phage tail tape measure protein
MALQLPVVQTGLEASIQAAMKSAGKSAVINLGTSAKQISSLSQPLGRITGQADQFTKSMEAANARVFAFGASVGIINSVSQALKSVVQNTIEVESSLASINTALNESGAGLQKFGDGLFNIAKNTSQTFKDVANGALELSRQGLGAEEVLKRLSDALILTRLSGLSSEDAVSGLTAAFNSFKETGITTAQILNKLVAVSQEYAVSERDLIEGIKRSGSTAKQAGVSFDELAGLITAVQEKTSRGGAVIGQSFKTIFAGLQNTSTISYLKDIGIQVTDLQGKLLPASKLLENLAAQFESFSALDQSDISQKLGGIYQLNNLLAAVQDLSSAQSVYRKAIEVSAKVSDEAYKKNAALNQTLEAIINKTLISAQQLGATLGELGVTDNLKNILNFFGGLLDSVQNLLREDSAVGTFFKGLAKGIGAVISGPGLALFGAIILKLSRDLVQFGFSSLKSFFGIGQAAKQIADVEKSVAQALSTNVSLQQRLLGLEGNRAAQLKIISAEIINQEAMLRRIASTSAAIAPGLYGSGVRSTGQGLRVPKAADGYMPAVAEEASSVKRGVGGAKASDKPVVIPNFNFGGGKRGTMVANSGEHIVPNFNGGSGSAIFNRDMVRKMGMPSGAQKINSAEGFIPNYAKKAIENINTKNKQLFGIGGLQGKDLKYNFDRYIVESESEKNGDQKTAPYVLAGRIFESRLQGLKYIDIQENKQEADIKKGNFKIAEAKLSGKAAYEDPSFGIPELMGGKGNRLVLPSTSSKEYDQRLEKNKKAEINRNTGISHNSLFGEARRIIEKYKNIPREQIGTKIPISANGFIPNFAISQREAAYNAWDSPLKNGKTFDFIKTASAQSGTSPNKTKAIEISKALDLHIAQNAIQIRDDYKSNKQEGVTARRADTTGAVAEFGMIYPSNSKGKVSSFLVGNQREVVKGIPIIGKPSDDLYPEVEKGIINAGMNYAKNLGFNPDIIQEERFAAGIKSNLNPGTIEAAFGTVFESVFQSAMEVPPNIGQTFDLPSRTKLNSFVGSMERGGILKASIAGNINPEMLAADFKNDLSDPNLSSMAQKISAFRLKEAAKGNTTERSARGFIPNFANTTVALGKDPEYARRQRERSAKAQKYRSATGTIGNLFKVLPEKFFADLVLGDAGHGLETEGIFKTIKDSAMYSASFAGPNAVKFVQSAESYGLKVSKTLQDKLAKLLVKATTKSGAKGFLPNFADPVQAAIGREMSAGVPASQIYIDQNASLKNAMNPNGLMVANRIDEPMGGSQGIARARKEGANPMTYGAANGFVPNYATMGSFQTPGNSTSNTQPPVNQSAAVTAATNAIAASIAAAVTKAMSASAPAAAAAPAKLPLPTPARPNAQINAAPPEPPKSGMSSEKMLGTIFAVQGGLSLLSGAFKDSASQIGKYTSIVADSLSNVSTAAFAMSGFSSIASSSNKLTAAFGKLGQVGAALGIAYEVFKGGKELYYEFSGANERAAKAANSLADAAKNAAANLQDYNPTEQTSIKKQAEEYVAQLTKGTYQFESASGEKTSMRAGLSIDDPMKEQLIKAFEMLQAGSVTKQEMDDFLKSSIREVQLKPVQLTDGMMGGKGGMYRESTPSKKSELQLKNEAAAAAAATPDYTAINSDFIGKKVESLLNKSTNDPIKVKSLIAGKSVGELTKIIESENLISDLIKDQGIGKTFAINIVKKTREQLQATSREEKEAVETRNIALEKYVRELGAESIYKNKIASFAQISANAEIAKQRELSALSNSLTVSAEDRSKIESLINLKYEERAGLVAQELSVLTSAKSLLEEGFSGTGVTAPAKQSITQGIPSLLKNNPNLFTDIAGATDTQSVLAQSLNILKQLGVEGDDSQEAAKALSLSFIKIGESIKDANKDLSTTTLKNKEILLIDLQRQKATEQINRDFQKYSNSLDTILNSRSIQNIAAESSIKIDEMRKNDVLSNPNTFSGIRTEAGRIEKTQQIEKESFDRRVQLEREIEDRQASIDLAKKLLTQDNISALNANTDTLGKLIDQLQQQIQQIKDSTPVDPQLISNQVNSSNIPNTPSNIDAAISKAVLYSGIQSTVVNKEQSQQFFGKDVPGPGDWKKLLTNIASEESGFDPKKTYEEKKIKDNQGKNVISTGLFQMSTESVNKWREKNNKPSITQEDLLDPQQNAMIAAEIMKQMIEESGGAIAGGNKNDGYQGLSKYWAVMRGERATKTNGLAVSAPTQENISNSNNLTPNSSLGAYGVNAYKDVNSSDAIIARANDLVNKLANQTLDSSQLSDAINAIAQTIDGSQDQITQYATNLTEQVSRIQASNAKIKAQNKERKTQDELEKNKQEGTFKSGLSSGFIELNKQTNNFQYKFGTEIPQLFSNGLASAIEGALDGTKSLKESLMDAATSFLKAISSKSISNMADLFTQGLGNFLPGFGAPQGAAAGGYIRGGSGSKDDVPAMLMGGEYVINKKSVNKYGPAFLEAINSGSLDGYAKGGKVKDYFTPGTYGVKQMTTDDDLLAFATQEYTSGSKDKISSGNGFASVSLEPESVRLTNFGRRNSPQAQRAKDVRKQMFGIYIDEMRKAAELKKQEEEEKKARKKAFKNALIMAGVSIAGSALVGGAMSGFKNAFSTSKLAGGTFAKNAMSGLGGMVTGGGVDGLQGNNYGGILNMFSKRGGITDASKYIQSTYGKDFIGPIQESQKVNAGNNINSNQSNANGLALPYGGGFDDGGLFPPGFLEKYTPAKRATGGSISQTAGIDTIPTMLSGGEFIMNKAAAENIGTGNLQAMNAGASKPVDEKASRDLNDKLISKFDELIGTTEKSTGSITINVDGSTGKSSEASTGQTQQSGQQLSRQIRDAVLKVIQEEKRLGGQLRRGM